VIAGCGEVYANITTSELIEDGYLSPLIVKIVSLEKLEKKLADKAEDGKKEYNRIKDEYVMGKDRNKCVIDETKKLLDEKRTVLVLVTEISHGRELRKLLEADLKRPVQFLFGETSSKKRTKVINDLRDGAENLVISTSIFEYGLDIPRLDGLVIASPSKSMIRTIQRVGRILRIHEGKANAKIVDFDDTNADYFREHFMERMIFYSAEPEFTLEYDGTRKDIIRLVNREKEVKRFLWEWERKKGRR
jgi:superfamily II DNA or RNA helicase